MSESKSGFKQPDAPRARASEINTTTYSRLLPPLSESKKRKFPTDSISGPSALYRAIQSGNETQALSEFYLITNFSETQLETFMPDSKGQPTACSLVDLAIKHDMLILLKKLLEENADQYSHFNLLSVAAHFGAKKCFTELLVREYMGDTEMDGFPVSATGDTVLHTLLRNKTYTNLYGPGGPYKNCCRLIREFPEMLAIKDNEGNLPITLALRNPFLSALPFFIRQTQLAIKCEQLIISLSNKITVDDIEKPLLEKKFMKLANEFNSLLKEIATYKEKKSAFIKKIPGLNSALNNIIRLITHYYLNVLQEHAEGLKLKIPPLFSITIEPDSDTDTEEVENSDSPEERDDEETVEIKLDSPSPPTPRR